MTRPAGSRVFVPADPARGADGPLQPGTVVRSVWTPGRPDRLVAYEVELLSGRREVYDLALCIFPRTVA